MRCREFSHGGIFDPSANFIESKYFHLYNTTTKGHIFGWTLLNKLQRGFQISFCQHICCNVMLFQKYNFCKKKVIYSEIITPKLQIHFYKRYLWDVVRKRMTRKMTLFFMPTSLWISVSVIHIISSPIVKFPEIKNFFFITDQT